MQKYVFFIAISMKLANFKKEMNWVIWNCMFGSCQTKEAAF